MRALRSLVPLLLVLAGPASLVGAGAVGVPPSARVASSADAGSVKWTTCPGYSNLRCASIPVPIDYAAPSLGTLKLAVAMLPSSSAKPLGDLFTNPGGPGASGVDFLEQNASAFPPSLRAKFDIVSWDPRGVERSDPVNCVNADETRTLTQEDPAPSTPAEIAEVVQLAKQFVDDCFAHTSRLLLEHVGTATTIEDLDRLRADLGQPKLFYLGFSYGTYIGEMYAAKYPTHIGEMVLDGAVDPALSLAAGDREQALGFEGDLHAFFSWCNKDATCHNRLPDGAKASYDALMAYLAAGNSITADFKPIYGGSQPVTLGVAELGVISSLYAKAAWPYLGLAIDRGLHHNGDLLAALAYEYEGLQQNGTFSNEEEANVAINCVDAPSPRWPRLLRAPGDPARCHRPGLRGRRGVGLAHLRLLAGPGRGTPARDPRSGNADDPRRRLDRRPRHAVRLGQGGRGAARQRRAADADGFGPHRILLQLVRAQLRQLVPRDRQAPAEGHGLPERLSPPAGRAATRRRRRETPWSAPRTAGNIPVQAVAPRSVRRLVAQRPLTPPVQRHSGSGQTFPAQGIVRSGWPNGLRRRAPKL